jgi:hypothetical protein
MRHAFWFFTASITFFLTAPAPALAERGWTVKEFVAGMRGIGERVPGLSGDPLSRLPVDRSTQAKVALLVAALPGALSKVERVRAAEGQISWRADLKPGTYELRTFSSKDIPALTVKVGSGTRVVFRGAIKGDQVAEGKLSFQNKKNGAPVVIKDNGVPWLKAVREASGAGVPFTLRLLSNPEDITLREISFKLSQSGNAPLKIAMGVSVDYLGRRDFDPVTVDLATADPHIVGALSKLVDPRGRYVGGLSLKTGPGGGKLTARWKGSFEGSKTSIGGAAFVQGALVPAASAVEEALEPFKASPGYYSLAGSMPGQGKARVDITKKTAGGEEVFRWTGEVHVGR